MQEGMEIEGTRRKKAKGAEKELRKQKNAERR